MNDSTRAEATPLAETMDSPGGIISRRMRNFLMAGVGLLIFALALTFVWNVLHEYSFRQIINSILSIPASAVALAILATIISYASISVYDYMALPYTEKRMPLTKTVFTSFCAYAISNSLGMTAVTSNAIRYRLYSSWGLGAAEVAVVAFITTLFLVLSALTLVSAGLLIDSEIFKTVFHLPKPLGAALGTVCAVVAGGGLVFFLRGPGTASFRKISINLPSKRHVTSQWIIGMIDWITMAATLYVLLPNSPEFTFLAFVPIFVAAHYAGAISGLPGGIGVFEAIVLLLVPTGDELAIAAALITFRSVYYFLPLVISVVMLTVHQGLHAKDRLSSGKTVATDFMESIAPVLFGLMTFLTGAVMLISSATPKFLPNVEFIVRFMPHAVIEISHLAASAIGTLLLLVSIGLQKRLYEAWRLAIILFAAGAALTLFKGSSAVQALFIAALGLSLFTAKHAFYRKGHVSDMRLTFSRLAAIFGSVGLALWSGFYAYRHKEYTNDLWWEFTLQDDASKFLRAAVIAAAILLIFFVWRALHPPAAIDTPETSDDTLDKVRGIITRAENATAEASLALIGDKKFLFSDSGNSFIMYGVKGQNWLTMGEPVGLMSERKELIRKFHRLADQSGAWPSFYAVRSDYLADFIDLGLAVQKIGETALVPLTNFSMEGSAKSKFRQSRNRAIKRGCSFEVIYPAADSPEMDTLEAVSDAWLKEHQGREKGFSLGRFDRALLAGAPIAVVRCDGQITAFANLWMTHDKRELSLDLMRHVEIGLNGMMDYLFAEIILWGSSEGYAYFCLGMAPLAGLDSHKLAPLMSKVGAFVYKHGGKIYGFEGLRAFKSKFDPQWEPVYLAAPSQFVMPIALGNLALLSSGGLKGLLTREN